MTERTTADGRPFRTDEGNLILDASFGAIADPSALLGQLQQRAGIVEVGLFLGMASVVLVATPEGDVRQLNRES